MRKRLVIAIDGPSGSGKSSVARAVAQRFGLQYLDTGAMYRAFAWWSIQGHADMSTCDLVISTDPAEARVSVSGHDITAAIRGPEVTAAVSAVAADPKVRALAVARQRDIIAGSVTGIVVEGRDITTVVAPDADVRIFLTADQTVRAARRAAEFEDAAMAAHMKATVAARDAIDSSRAHSPLREGDGVTRIDATDLDLPQVIDAVVELVRRQQEGDRA